MITINATSTDKEMLSAAAEYLPTLVTDWSEAATEEQSKACATVIATIVRRWPFLARKVNLRKLQLIMKEAG